MRFVCSVCTKEILRPIGAKCGRTDSLCYPCSICAEYMRGPRLLHIEYHIAGFMGDDVGIVFVAVVAIRRTRR